ncbi:MAG: hypothetical protein QOF67_1252, partial [Mycobacterium sp.]|nr:hypothetical protein [Mycobacterium sp.]
IQNGRATVQSQTRRLFYTLMLGRAFPERK